MSLLDVRDLKTYFYIDNEVIPAVDGVNFNINKGEIVALVGESGSGKSVTSLSIMGLIKEPGKIVNGEIIFNKEDLLSKKEREMRRIRGKDIAMIYQDPMSSLNPYIRVGNQIAETLIIHKKISKADAKKEAIKMMELVGIPDADKRYKDYPSQFSGGMRQRIMIAMAIACEPKLLIADEPTTALDVTVQAEILDLLRRLMKDNGMSILLITHDLGVVAEIADRVCIMYCGKIMEQSSKISLFKNPLNPYTRGLIQCIPRTDDKAEVLYTIGGNVPYPTDFPKGCRFSTRCPDVMEKCKKEIPALADIGERHLVRCFLYENSEVKKYDDN
ncbi:ABC transporter ATP-binding protein [Tissierella pigra]|uniref:ABC transporter ATP-binding protein n=1 Tax=Tissierella pigra TaxID=2607614 RepID=A0A6N7XYP2_9FIRM|nr:ABC transporter ATP-binding protein [Tissierella pigra]MBU5427265.1 ABC transporter ATP-binding protein [Tissierella pigra]MSU02573.1 ABC transporter ATP-binding protein [Tissierella pigra]